MRAIRSTGHGDRTPGRPVFWAPLGRELAIVRPHLTAHWGAVRAAVGLLVPVVVVLATGHVVLVPAVAFGAFAAVFGRHATYRARLVMQSGVVVAMATTIVATGLLQVLGVGSVWTAVALGVVSVAGFAAARRFGWLPIPSVFLLFAAGSMLTGSPSASGVVLASVAAAASGAFTVGIGQLGRLFPDSPRDRHARVRVPVRALLGAGGFRADAIGHFLAPAGAAIVAHAIGSPHAAWAAVAAVVPLGASAVHAQVGRAVNRFVGTAVGVVVTALILAAEPSQEVLVGVVVLGMFAVEMFIARHYGIASVGITPVALLMGELTHRSDPTGLLVDRITETAIGVAVAVVVVLARDAVDRFRPSPR